MHETHDHDPLIEQLRQLDNRRTAIQSLSPPESLVQYVVKASSSRRHQRRAAVASLSFASMLLIAGAIVWRAPSVTDNRLANTGSSITDTSKQPKQESVEPAIPHQLPESTSRQSVDRSPSKVQPVAADSMRLPDEDLLRTHDIAEELQKLEQARIELLKQLDEVQAQIRRAELTQRVLNETEIPHDLFY